MIHVTIPVRGRAYSKQGKRAVMERILAAWVDSPDERLGQLIVNALPVGLDGDPFYIEDLDLAEACEARAKRQVKS